MSPGVGTDAPVVGSEGTGRRAGLDRDDVLDAALALVEEHGADALTMRGLASALGVTTTTIYWHVGGRDELVLGVIERLSERNAAVAVEGDGPRERVMCLVRQLWQTSLGHPNVTSLAHQVGASAVLGIDLERAIARELVAAGLGPEEVRDGLRALLMCTAGFLVTGLRAADAVPDDRRSETLWAQVADPSVPLATRRALTRAPDLPALFETTLSSVVASLVPSVPRPRAGGAESSPPSGDPGDPTDPSGRSHE